MTMPTDKEPDLDIFYGKKLIARLTRSLVKAQKVSPENIELLKKSHVFKHLLFETANNTDDAQTLKALASLFERLEFEQQKLWGFTQDKTKHNWFTFPKCSCVNKQHSGSCVIHDHLNHECNESIK